MTDTDLVVVLPGIMGSTLGVAMDDQPASQNLIWAPTGGAVWRNLTGAGPRIQDYVLPDGIGDGPPEDHVEPVALMPDVHVIPGIWTPVKGYTRLLRRLEQLGYRPEQDDNGQPEKDRSGNLLPVPYDWRLSNRYNGQRLAGIVEPALDRWRRQGGRYADAQLVFVCHSMGGLVARWYLEKCGGAAHTRKLITLGTPWRGAAKTLEQLVNGVRPGIGPIHVDLTAFAQSLPSLYQLLPEYACITDGPRPHRKTTETSLPGLTTARVADAMAFYTALQDAEKARHGSTDMARAIVGTRQPTCTTITFDPNGGSAVPSETFGTDNDYGDGTVPLTGAIGHGDPMDTNRAFRVRDQHGNLQRNQTVLDEIEELLTTKPVRRRATYPANLRVTAPDLILATQPLDVHADIEANDSRRALRITVTDESGRVLQARQPQVKAGHAYAQFTDLPPGTHTITLDSPPAQPGGPGAPPNLAGPIEPVTATTLIWPGPAWTGR